MGGADAAAPRVERAAAAYASRRVPSAAFRRRTPR
jgi:hypothetical protein